MQPEIAASSKCAVGEAPLWHPDEKKLYWVDTPSAILRRYDPVAEVTEVCSEDEHIAGLTIQASGSLLLFTAEGAIKSWWNGKMLVVRESAVAGPFNDVVAYPLGRVFAGVKATANHSGRIYRIERDTSVHLVIDDLLQPNGMAFSLDRRRFYITDTGRGEIYQLDYDPGTGDVCNKTVLVSHPEDAGKPDGLTVDSDGFLWSAQWNGGCVIRYSPEGVEDRRIELPATKPSSLTFGSVDYTDLYVSTAVGDDWEDTAPEAGSLFRVQVGVRGVPEFWSRVGL